MGINWDLFDSITRGLALLTHLGTMTAAAWGFLVAHALFSQDRDLGDDLSSVNLGVFIGLMAAYYVIFGGLGFLAELRQPRIKGSILKGFGFLHSHVGRGCFMFYIGTVFVLLPWDEKKKYVSKIPASFEIAVGLLEIIIGTCGGRRADGSGGPSGPPRTPGQKVFVDGEDALDHSEASGGSSSSTSVAFSGASTPLPVRERAVLNPLNGLNSGAGSSSSSSSPVPPADEGSSGAPPVITKNPFLAGGGGAAPQAAGS